MFGPEKVRLAESMSVSSTHGVSPGRIRAHNERVILSELRRGTLSRAQLARRSGLSAQAIGLIAKSLISEGLIDAGDPVRGRVGQPSVPLSLRPEAAWFAGLKIGRRSAELVLIDFTGGMVRRERLNYAWPTPEAIEAFLVRVWPGLITGIDINRMQGLGVAMPYRLWEWPERLGVPGAELAQWRDYQPTVELTKIVDAPVLLENDAAAACGAELTFGNGRTYRNFAYLYIGYFIGGGIVLDAKVHVGATGHAAAFGTLPVPDPDKTGKLIPLIDAASLHVLERMISDATDSPVPPIHDETSATWAQHRDVVQSWIELTSEALATATLSLASILELDAVIIDGPFPATIRDDLVAQVEDALGALDTRGVRQPHIVAGSLGSSARALGAARLHLFTRFLVDKHLLTATDGE